MKCDYCGANEDLPFTCNYCGGTFCSEHRLPEAHACKGDLSRRTVASPSRNSWDGSVFSRTTTGGRTPFIFSQKEVRDILIAWAALGLAFTIADCDVLRGNGCPISAGPVTFFFVSLVAVGSGFVLHELMHKFTAERYGYWAEFRMWTSGIILALVTSTLHFIFAAPGATYIQGSNVTEKENGIISVAGPLTNVAISGIFLLVGIVVTGNALIGDIASIGFSVNVFLAMFNMLPIMPLDGAKVFRWNKLYWTVVFFPLLFIILTVFFGL